MSDMIALLCSYVGAKGLQALSPSISWGTYSPLLTWTLYSGAMAETTPNLFRLLSVAQLLLGGATMITAGRRNPVALATLVYPCVPSLVLWLWRPTVLSKVFKSAFVGYLAVALLIHDIVCFLVCTMLFPAPVVATLVDCAKERDRALSIPGVSQVWISSSSGARLDALVFRPSSMTGGVESTTEWLVYLGGNGEVYEMTYDSQIQLANKLKVNLAIFNSRGVGRSGGQIRSAKDLVDDAASVIQHLMQVEHARQEDILVFGHSIGGGVAAQLVATRFPQLSIVLDRSFSSLSDAAVSLSPIFRSRPALIESVMNHAFGDLDSVDAWKRIAHERKLITFHRLDQIIRFRESSIARLSGQQHFEPKYFVEFTGVGSDPHNMPSTTFRGHETMIDKMRGFYKS